MKHLFDTRIVGKIKHGVKLLAKVPKTFHFMPENTYLFVCEMQGADRLQQPVDIEVTRASKSAIKAVEATGGRVTTVYFNKFVHF